MIFDDFGSPFLLHFGVVLPCGILMKTAIPTFSALLPDPPHPPPWSVAEAIPGRRDFREVAKANSLELRCNAQQYNSLYRCAVHMLLALRKMADHIVVWHARCRQGKPCRGAFTGYRLCHRPLHDLMI